MLTRRSLDLETCARGASETRPRLFVREPPQPSLLILRSLGLETEHVLKPRWAILLLILVDAYNADRGYPESLRGFRTGEQIGRAYRNFESRSARVEPKTVVTYFYELRNALDASTTATATATEADGAPTERFDLLEHGRGRGYRIGPLGMEVVVGSSDDED
jgi:hypothetical protein